MPHIQVKSEELQILYTIVHQNNKSCSMSCDTCRQFCMLNWKRMALKATITYKLKKHFHNSMQVKHKILVTPVMHYISSK